jgi:hypothetical protein
LRRGREPSPCGRAQSSTVRAISFLTAHITSPSVKSDSPLSFSAHSDSPSASASVHPGRCHKLYSLFVLSGFSYQPWIFRSLVRHGLNGSFLALMPGVNGIFSHFAVVWSICRR